MSGFLKPASSIVPVGKIWHRCSKLKGLSEPDILVDTGTVDMLVQFVTLTRQVHPSSIGHIQTSVSIPPSR